MLSTKVFAKAFIMFVEVQLDIRTGFEDSSSGLNWGLFSSKKEYIYTFNDIAAVYIWRFKIRATWNMRFPSYE